MSVLSDIGGALGDVSSGIGGIFDPISGLIGGISSIFGGNSANKKAAQQAQAQMNFQERMRDTQYQSKVKDLMAAGLNPMLAYGGGGNAAPSGTSAPVIDAISSGVSSANQARQVTAAVKAQESQVELNKALESKAANDALVSAYNATSAGMTIKENVAAIKAEANMKTQAADITAKAMRNHPDLYEWGDVISKFFGPAASSASSASNVFK